MRDVRSAATPGRLAGATAAGVACVVAAGVALAQDTPPTVTITMGAKAVRVAGAGGLAPGETTLVVRGRRPMALLELKPSVTPRELRRALARGIDEPAQARPYGTLVAGGNGTRRGPYTTTISLRARTYAVIDIAGRPKLRATFAAAGSPTTATAPTPDATVVMRDFVFDGPRTLPADGVVRWENRGRQIHEAILARLKPGTSAKPIVRLIRRGENPPRRVLAGFATGVGAVDRGTVNDVSTPMPPGSYVMVCFLPDERAGNRRRARPHTALGMVRAVRVR
jgi:hypothetical protein